VKGRGMGKGRARSMLLITLRMKFLSYTVSQSQSPSLALVGMRTCVYLGDSLSLCLWEQGHGVIEEHDVCGGRICSRLSCRQSCTRALVAQSRRHFHRIHRRWGW
jgi:hypothetical protein